MDSPVLSVIGMLAVVLLVLVGTYLFTRWAGRNLGSFGALPGGQIQVLDRVNLGRDQAILVVRAGQRYLLLGSTPSGVTLLAELTREEGENWRPPAPQPGGSGKPDFQALLKRMREKKND